MLDCRDDGSQIAWMLKCTLDLNFEIWRSEKWRPNTEIQANICVMFYFMVSDWSTFYKNKCPIRFLIVLFLLIILILITIFISAISHSMLYCPCHFICLFHRTSEDIEQWLNIFAYFVLYYTSVLTNLVSMMHITNISFSSQSPNKKQICLFS